MLRHSSLTVLAIASVVGSFAALGSCANDSAVPPAPMLGAPFADGDRLRARYFELVGGVKVFRSWFDTERNEECTFQNVSRSPVCLPTNAAKVSSTEFADAACTQPLALASSDDVPTTAIAASLNACDSDPTIFAIGQHASVRYQAASGGGCALDDANNSTLFFTVAEEIPLSSFGHANARYETTGARIGGLTLAGVDGSREVIDGWDSQRNERVTPFQGRWFPAGISYSSWDRGSVIYSDSACKNGVAQKDGFDAVCPVTTVDLDPAGLSTVGKRLSPSDLYFMDSNGTCSHAPFTDDAELFFEVGAPIATTELATVTTLEQGTGRIHASLAGSETKAIVSDGTPLWDTSLSTSCAIQVASDAVDRCLPETTDASLYVDAACTQRMFQFLMSDTPGSIRSVIEPYEGAPEAKAIVYQVGTTVTPSANVYQRISPTECAALATPDGFQYFLVGAVVAPDQFEEAVRHD